jgi:acylpyruvate hydrolase
MNLAQKAIDFVQNHADFVKYKVFHNVPEVKIEAPVLNPGKMICVGHNYREHILEMGRGLPDFPVVFAKFSTSRYVSTNCHVDRRNNIDQARYFVVSK